MKSTARFVIFSFASLLMVPMWGAFPPGNSVSSYAINSALESDFKNGVGIHDPLDSQNPCTRLLFGASARGASHYYSSLRIGTNLNGEAVYTGISDLGGVGNVDTGVPCPIPGSPPTTLWTQFDGANLAAPVDFITTEINLCSQLALAIGCLPNPGGPLSVWAGDCPWALSSSTKSPLDFKGMNSLLEDFVQGRNFVCAGGLLHSHDYSSTITQFATNYAAQRLELIKTEDVVHGGGGSKYLVVCWEISYLVNGITPQTGFAHDWLLILDVDTPASWSPALAHHVAPSSDGRLFPLLYDLGGDNGFGPCTSPSPGHNNKPTPII